MISTLTVMGIEKGFTEVYFRRNDFEGIGFVELFFYNSITNTALYYYCEACFYILEANRYLPIFQPLKYKFKTKQDDSLKIERFSKNGSVYILLENRDVFYIGITWIDNNPFEDVFIYSENPENLAYEVVEYTVKNKNINIPSMLFWNFPVKIKKVTHTLAQYEKALESCLAGDELEIYEKDPILNIQTSKIENSEKSPPKFRHKIGLILLITALVVLLIYFALGILYSTG